MKSISIDTDALMMEVVMMIFDPVYGCGCHPKSERAREVVVTEKKEHKLETKTSKH